MEGDSDFPPLKLWCALVDVHHVKKLSDMRTCNFHRVPLYPKIENWLSLKVSITSSRGFSVDIFSKGSMGGAVTHQLPKEISRVGEYTAKRFRSSASAWNKRGVGFELFDKRAQCHSQQVSQGHV